MNLDYWRSGVEALTTWLWETNGRGSILIGIVFLIQFFFRKQLKAQGCYWLSMLVLARLLLPVSPASSLSAFNLAQFNNPLPKTNEVLAISVPAVLQRIDGLRTLRTQDVPFQSVKSLGNGSSSTSKAANLAAGIWLLGFCVCLGRVAWQHGRLSRWARSQSAVIEPELLGILADAKRIMGIQRSLSILLGPEGSCPALFGWFKPRLLIPQSAIVQLEAAELRLVLLHELAHLRRRDILLNWIMIFAQSLHWFNPLVWLAMRRLRADRELVCDAMVLKVVPKDEHRIYGHTLVKLLEGFAGIQPTPSVVPVIDNKIEIKRRIIMISHFKPATPAVMTVLAAFVALVGILTLTRAADSKKPEPAVLNPSLPAANETPRKRDREIKRLTESLNRLDSEVDARETEVAQLRLEMGVPGNVVDLENGTSLDTATLRQLEHERIEAEARSAQFQCLFDKLKDLKRKSPSELAQVLPTTVPDQELTRLLGELNTAEASFAKNAASGEYGADHPQTQSIKATISALRKQVQERTDGILMGLEAQVAAQKATSESIQKQVAESKRSDLKAMQIYRPYFRAKHDLMLRQQTRDSLIRRILEQQIEQEDSDAEESAPKKAPGVSSP